MKRRNLMLRMFIAVFSLALSTLACSFTDAGQGGPSQNDLAATQVSVQATQLALQAVQLQLTQQALEARQEPAPTEPQALPDQQPAPDQQPTQPAGPDVSFEGVSFSYDDSLGRDVSLQIVPSDLGEGPYWGLPEHIELGMVGYPVANDYHQPTVFVFSVADYRAGSESASEIIDRLHALLDSRPPNPDEGIPLLPIYNAGELGWTKVAYFDFQNGSGVRFVTQLGQAFWPFHNRAMFYTYQGLTADGRYYLSVIMPLSHPMLNEYDNYQPPDNFYDLAETLVRDQVAGLNGQPDESFTPNIAVLDEMVRSLRIDK